MTELEVTDERADATSEMSNDHKNLIGDLKKKESLHLSTGQPSHHKNCA